MSSPQHGFEGDNDMDSQIEINDESMKTFCIDVCGGDLDTISELLEMYLSSLDELTNQMASSVASGDTVLLRRASHTLKSSTRVFGAEALAQSCERLEQIALSGDLSPAPALLHRVELQRQAMHLQLPAAVESILESH